jgi:hypothetical protein
MALNVSSMHHSNSSSAGKEYGSEKKEVNGTKVYLTNDELLR